MAFERYPYTNFHDLNLDWIIQQVTEWAKEWAQVKELLEQIDYDFTEFNNRLNSVEAATLRLDGITSRLQINVRDLSEIVAGLVSSMEIAQQDIANNYDELDSRVSVLEDSIVTYMFSPFTGLYEPITTVISELAQFHLEDALTADEYDTLDMTAAYYDAKMLTAYQYDSSGKILLP